METSLSPDQLYRLHEDGKSREAFQGLSQLYETALGHADEQPDKNLARMVVVVGMAALMQARTADERARILSGVLDTIMIDYPITESRDDLYEKAREWSDVYPDRMLPSAPALEDLYKALVIIESLAEHAGDTELFQRVGCMISGIVHIIERLCKTEDVENDPAILQASIKLGLRGSEKQYERWMAIRGNPAAPTFSSREALQVSAYAIGNIESGVERVGQVLRYLVDAAKHSRREHSLGVLLFALVKLIEHAVPEMRVRARHLVLRENAAAVLTGSRSRIDELLQHQSVHLLVRGATDTDKEVKGAGIQSADQSDRVISLPLWEKCVRSK